MPTPNVDAISTKTIGFMGEGLTAFLLESEFGGQDLRVARLGDEELPWDLFIFEPARNTPFRGPTAIEVKARTVRSPYAGLTKDVFLDRRHRAEAVGYGLWFSFVHYHFKNGHMRFAVYMVPERNIDEGDFKERKEFGRDIEELKMADMKEKAVLTFGSRKMGIEDDVEGEDKMKMDHVVMKGVSTDMAGSWGEDMAAFLLASEFKDDGLQVANVGRGYEPYDLFIDNGKEGSVFSELAAISVKANTGDSTWSKPSFEELAEQREELKGRGIKLWMALLQTYYTKRELGFGMYLIDAQDLDREDFADVKGDAKRTNLLSFVRARKKAVRRIWTEGM